MTELMRPASPPSPQELAALKDAAVLRAQALRSEALDEAWAALRALPRRLFAPRRVPRLPTVWWLRVLNL